MDEHQFNRLIKRYQENSLSEKERALLEEWLESFSSEATDVNWTDAEKGRLKQRVLARIAHAEGRSRGIERSLPGTISFGRAMKVAAAVLLLLSVTFLLREVAPLDPDATSASQVSPPAVAVKKVMLADGSIVWLKGNSTLVYPEQFEEGVRQVKLEGEALFEVARDVTRPFVIRCGGLTTTVLGTSFNIRSMEDNIEVVVLTGKVALTSESDPEPVIVLPNEKALYWVDRKAIAKVEDAIDRKESFQAVAGTEYQMHFEDTRMEEVIRRIEGKFEVNVELEDPGMANCIITADFTGQPLNRTLTMIAQALRAQYEVKGNTIILTGAGC